MATTSNLVSLSEQIKARTEADRELIESQTAKLLEQHAESWTQLSNAALSTTRSVIESESAKLTQALTGLAATIDKQSATVAKSTGRLKSQTDAQVQNLEAETKRLVWLMRWPILGTIVVCLAICGLTWAYWKLAEPWTTERTSAGTYQILKGNWTMCNVGTAKQPINQPCRQAN